MVMRGSAFSPGHITGLFSVHDSSEVYLRKGSRGCGLSVSLGALVSVSLIPPDETGSSGPIDMELKVRPVEDFPVNDGIYRSVLEELLPGRGMGWKANVKVTLQLPVGQGFGMSGAGSLATAIAVWEAMHSEVPRWERNLMFKGQQELFFSVSEPDFRVRPIRKRFRSHVELLSASGDAPAPVQPFGKPSGMIEDGGVRPPRRWLDESRTDRASENITYSDCVNVAHRIDVINQGGLGDVVASARGGVEIRMAPGVPPYGEIHTIPVALDDVPKVIAGIVGAPLTTKSVLTNPAKRERIHDAGESALKRLVGSPGVERMMAESRQFSIESGLQSLQIRSAISEVDGTTTASQIMLGNSVFAIVSGKDKAAMDRVKEAWSRNGRVYCMDIDLMGARPVN